MRQAGTVGRGFLPASRLRSPPPAPWEEKVPHRLANASQKAMHGSISGRDIVSAVGRCRAGGDRHRGRLPGPLPLRRATAADLHRGQASAAGCRSVCLVLQCHFQMRLSAFNLAETPNTHFS